LEEGETQDKSRSENAPLYPDAEADTLLSAWHPPWRLLPEQPWSGLVPQSWAKQIFVIKMRHQSQNQLDLSILPNSTFKT